MSPEPANIVALAVGAAGTADANWDKRVAALIPRVATLFIEPQDADDSRSAVAVARKVLESHSFQAEYRDHEYREEDQRIYVRIYDPKRQEGEGLDADGCQTVRTEPMWSPFGRAIREILNGMQPNQPAVFYRYTEPVPGSNTKKMGVLVHLEPRKPRRNQTPPAGSGEPRTAPSSSRPASQAPPADSADPAGGAEPSKAIAHRVDELDNRQKVAYMHATRAEGINGMAPEFEQLDRALVLLGQIERGEKVVS